MTVPNVSLNDPATSTWANAVADTVNDLIARKSWQVVDSGSVSAASTATINVPSGEYRQLRLRLVGIGSASPTDVFVRINGDTTAGVHRRCTIVRQVSDGAVTFSLQTDATAFLVARWGNVDGCVGEITLHNTDSSSNVPYISRGSLIHSSNGSITDGWGRLLSTHLVTSLELTAGTNTITASWVLEGLPA